MEGIQPSLLITDDDRDFRESLGELLARRGLNTILAEDGQEALSILRKSTVHILLLDMHMPRLSGIETLETLHTMSVRIPAILMSAKLDDRIVCRAHELSAASVLSKPFSAKTLTETVASILQSVYGWTGRM